MNFYRISADPTAANTYVGTQIEAHALVKTLPQDSGTGGDERRVELVEVPLDKESVVHILNSTGPDFKLLRTWKLSPRGGMVECENGE